MEHESRKDEDEVVTWVPDPVQGYAAPVSQDADEVVHSDSDEAPEAPPEELRSDLSEEHQVEKAINDPANDEIFEHLKHKD